LNIKYQVLARRYRPQLFSDVVGHEAVLQTLKNSIRREAVAHAYLFSGSRGVGKTTLARLFAKTLNCNDLSTELEPCNKCPSCLDVTSAQSLDVIEIDGASNRGIDDIRQINETVGFAPSYGKYKITIIDEVHMLTKEAFNALLKTLEEPPERAKFFFATTEPYKVPPTILSRCQRFDLSRLLPSQIIAKLEKIAIDLGRPTSLEALHLIANSAEGSLRDAESLFDQVLCFAGDTVTEADARKVLGLAPEELFFGFDLAFSESRFAYAFELVQQLFQTGIEFGHFISGLILHYRHLLVCKTLSPEGMGLPPKLTKRYVASSSFYTQQQCFSALDLCLKTEAGFSKVLAPRTALELMLLQILRTKNRIPIEALIRRLSDLEESLMQERDRSALEPPIIPPLPLATPSGLAPATEALSISEKKEVSATTPAECKIPIPEPHQNCPIESQIATPIYSARLDLGNSGEPRGDPDSSKIKGNDAPPNSSTLTAQSLQPIEQIKHTAKHPSHYDTLIRFAAVELEGTVLKP
jgi:DNA polymerase-3 subunit gamma/tau